MRLEFALLTIMDSRGLWPISLRYRCSCQSGVWVHPGIPRQYAYFGSATCPAGWLLADGTQGTVDLRGEFIRGLDGGRGVDRFRSLGSAQRATFIGMGTGPIPDGIVAFFEAHGEAGRDQASMDELNLNDYPGARVSNAGNSTTPILLPHHTDITYGGARPRNVALLACMKR